MKEEEMLTKQIKYWNDSAIKDFDTAEYLHKGNKYEACLFFCHLSLEKILKSIAVYATKKVAPYTHDLEKLSKIANLSLTEEQEKNLRVITGFNIEGRYSDMQFQEKYTQEYVKKYFKISKNLFKWLQKKYQ